MNPYQPGDKFALDVELVRLVNQNETVRLQDGTTFELDNSRQNKWWARTIPGDDSSLILIVVDPRPEIPQSLRAFQLNTEKLLTCVWQVQKQLDDMRESFNTAREQYLNLCRQYHIAQPPVHPQQHE